MTFEQIEKLSEMGFTPDQIMSLSGSAQPEPVEPEPITEQKPVEPEPKQEQDVRIEKLQNQVNDLIKQIQSSNLKTASINILPDDALEKATDAAMAELIRPTIRKEGINK